MNLYSDLIERRSFEDRRQIDSDLEASHRSIQREERRRSQRRHIYWPTDGGIRRYPWESEQEATANSLRQSGMVVR